VRPDDVRQWRFRAHGTQIRVGSLVALHNDAFRVDLVIGVVQLPEGPSVPTALLPASPVGPASASSGQDTPQDCVTCTLTGVDPVSLRISRSSASPGGLRGPDVVRAVTLHRPGVSSRPLCGGEPVALHLAGIGYLASGEPGSAEVVVRREPAVEWVVTGVAPGVAVPVERPVGLFDTVQGDHLVCLPREGTSGPAVGVREAGRRALLPADLRGPDLPSADLRGPDLPSADLRGPDLPSADLRGPDLPSADLRGPDLPSADPQGRGLSSAAPQGRGLPGQDLLGTDRRGAQAPVLGWSSTGSRPAVALPPVTLPPVALPPVTLPPVALPPVTLPMPPAFRPPEGVPGDAELAGVMVPVRDGDPEAGLLLLLDPAAGRSLGDHLSRRSPGLAPRLAPNGEVDVVACRWSAAGDSSQVRPSLPPSGSRLWVQGLLVADPVVSLNPVRALAWALDADGEAVTAAPGTGGWPETVLTWRLLMLPLPEASGPAQCAFHLPLPGRDGEPGTATTLTPASERGAGLSTGSRAGWRPGGRVSTSAALVLGVTGSRRVLRMAMAPDHGGRLQVLGCTVRVHLPG
jgi:hypothetical protein